MGGGTVGNFWAAGIFFVIKFIVWIFFRVNWCAWFFFEFSLARILLLHSPPPPISFLMVRPLVHVIETLRSNDADDNENAKKTIGLISKTTTSHVHLTFLYLSFPFLHDYDVKMPNLAFCGGRKQAKTKLYFSLWAWIWSLEIQLQEGSPTVDKVSG